MASDQQLQDLLNFDALAEAEKVTGKSYKEDDETQALGFFLLQLRSKAREAELTGRNDTVFRNTLQRYKFIIEGYGFECVYTEPFVSHDRDECFFIYWHPDGLILAFDTYHTDQVSGANVHYNWKRNPESDYWPSASSHAWCEDWDDFDSPRILAQSLDAREALIFNLEQLRANGEFVKPWVLEPMLWSLTHHGDKEFTGGINDPGWAQSRQALRAKRVAALPQRVRDVIESVVS